ncbi:sulfatase-like hydrolase/transferase [Thalassotalea fonticola]|uniref:Sulfatase-like hydrolase/transferase n=1 Tax=Thalassotalea fonticola TaxID=3065649 RepID=A0ABZ0GK88_9GAMM|nr:sulfatase-like hydrolase/transferase [Colwelliaceae bacterium S1-1]
MKFVKVFFGCLVILLTACNKDNATEKRDLDSSASTRGKPNLIIFYIDDLGYGDVSSYGAAGVNTPNIDSLASKGVKFTDAHSTAATCTPSRYSLLTGEHGFRSNAAILPGDAPALIPPGKPTLPRLLKKAGYTTGVVGKWHLGLGDGFVDWNKAVKPGPLEIGFDYSFLLPATGDRVPTVYLENHHVVNLDLKDPIEVSYSEKVGDRPTGIDHPELLKFKADKQHSQTIINGISRIGTMSGGENALWIDEQFPDVFTSKAVEFIRKNKKNPFFLFHSFHDIHVPRVPNPRFKGKSMMGPRGDAIVQMDWMVGEVMKELKIQDLLENTLVMFTSDNGPVLDDGYDDKALEMLGKHRPSGPLKGGKYSAFEGGTRMPMIVYWSGKTKALVSDALISQVDIYASMASLLGIELASDEAIDSQNLMDAWLGKTTTARDYMIEESVGTLSLRKNQWKYIIPIPTDKILPAWLSNKDIEMGYSKEPQLYNLAIDLGEKNNVAASNPKLVISLQRKADEFIAKGFRTTDN